MQNTQDRVTALCAQLAEAEQQLAQERVDEMRVRMRELARAGVDATPSAFYADGGDGQSGRAVLPFGADYPKWNPRDVEHAAFGKSWLAGMTALICRRRDQGRTRPTRLVFTSGGGIPSTGDRIGCNFTAYHDQTGHKLGVYEVVGIVIYDEFGDVARIVGDVPDIKFAQSTYK